MRNALIMTLAAVFALSLTVADFADARGGGVRGGGAAGARGGGGRSAATNIQRPSGGANVSRNGNLNGNGNGNFNNNRNINANVNRNVNVNVDNNWNHGGCCGGGYYHPVATGVAIGAAAAVTAAAIGSMAYSLPPACISRAYPAGTYYSCGSTWYQPQYSGSQVTYVVVNNPG